MAGFPHDPRAAAAIDSDDGRIEANSDDESSLSRVRGELTQLLRARTRNGGLISDDAVRYEQLVAAEAAILRRERSAAQLGVVAAERGESGLAVRVVTGHGPIPEAEAPEARDASTDQVAELRAVQSERHDLLQRQARWSFEGGEAGRYTKLTRREVFLRGLAPDGPAALSAATAYDATSSISDPESRRTVECRHDG